MIDLFIYLMLCYCRCFIRDQFTGYFSLSGNNNDDDCYYDRDVDYGDGDGDDDCSCDDFKYH